MTSISSVSSTNSIYQTSQTSAGHSAHRMKPDNDQRQGKDGGGLMGAIDTALKSAGISGGLSSIFGDPSASSTSSASSTNDTTS